MTDETTTTYVPAGAELILAERQRQINVEGWSIEHDREHGASRLAWAGWFYESHGRGGNWPFDHGQSAKLKGPLRNLVRAGALFQAAADVAPEEGYWNREHYERRCAAVEDKIDALIAEVRSVLDA